MVYSFTVALGCFYITHIADQGKNLTNNLLLLFDYNTVLLCTSMNAPRKYLDTTETLKCLSIIALDQCFSKRGAGQIFYRFKGGYDQKSLRTTAIRHKILLFTDFT